MIAYLPARKISTARWHFSPRIVTDPRFTIGLRGFPVGSCTTSHRVLRETTLRIRSSTQTQSSGCAHSLIQTPCDMYLGSSRFVQVSIPPQASRLTSPPPLRTPSDKSLTFLQRCRHWTKNSLSRRSELPSHATPYHILACASRPWHLMRYLRALSESTTAPMLGVCI